MAIGVGVIAWLVLGLLVRWGLRSGQRRGEDNVQQSVALWFGIVPLGIGAALALVVGMVLIVVAILRV